MATAFARTDTPLARVGIVTVSDRASAGDYEDRGAPAIRNYLERILTSDWTSQARLVSDEQDQIEEAIRSLAADSCCLILTTGRHRASRS